MKQVLKDKIINCDENIFDNKFLFEISVGGLQKSGDIEIIYMSDLLENRKNTQILEKVKEKPAMYSNVYSAKDELEIFTGIFDEAIKNKKRVHIIGITLKEEIDYLEDYYTNLGFLRQDINCFDVDFSVPLVTVSVCIENIIWKGSDYKAFRDKIFFNPPIRESGQVKALFKGINRGVVAGIYIKKIDEKIDSFLSEQITGEHILPLTFSRVLNYNYLDIGIFGEKKEIEGE